MRGPFASLARLPLGSVPFTAPAANSNDASLVKVGRRGAPRLRLSVPAKLVTLTETRRCVLLDLSRSGARIGVAKPLDVGDGSILRFSDYEVFGCVIRKEDGRNGLEFDVELSDDDVLATRHYAESYEASERRALFDQAREWVTGASNF